MLGAVELCDSVMQVEASSAEDTSDISVLWQIKPYPWRLFAKLNRYRFLQQPIRVGFVCLRHLRYFFRYRLHSRN